MNTTGRSTWWWRALLIVARVILAPFCRLRVCGELPPGPVILAANHINPVDPVVLMAACHTRRADPRFLADAAAFHLPLVGAVLRHAGHIPVRRGTTAVSAALVCAVDAVRAGATVLVYPEGRIGLDPGMWPERGKTGAARLALATGAPVVPVAQWGAHELVPYAAPRGAVRGLARALMRRPVVRVRFAPPVDLTGARTAREATDRIITAITDTLRPLRPDEPDRPRHADPTRPAL
ncbi:lysophospholipid acyltransferase family protein [Actinomycetes bacterium KLBMP 9797]